MNTYIDTQKDYNNLEFLYDLNSLTDELNNILSKINITNICFGFYISGIMSLMIKVRPEYQSQYRLFRLGYRTMGSWYATHECFNKSIQDIPNLCKWILCEFDNSNLLDIDETDRMFLKIMSSVNSIDELKLKLQIMGYV